MTRSLAIITVLFGAAACSSLDLSSTQQFDLSGTWRLVPSLSDAAPNPRRMMNRADNQSINRDPRAQQRSRINGAVFAFVVQDFPVLAAHTMRIEQHADSMGVDYDPGNYRDVTWGERERGLWDVHAGWDDAGDLVIDSRTGDLRGVERMRLEADQLFIDVSISGRGPDITVRRVYQRI